MTVEEAGRALEQWGERIDALQRRGIRSRGLDRLAATHDNLLRIHHAVTPSTPAAAVERFVLRTGKFAEEAARVLGELAAQL